MLEEQPKQPRTPPWVLAVIMAVGLVMLVPVVVELVRNPSGLFVDPVRLFGKWAPRLEALDTASESCRGAPYGYECGKAIEGIGNAARELEAEARSNGFGYGALADTAREMGEDADKYAQCSAAFAVEPPGRTCDQAFTRVRDGADALLFHIKKVEFPQTKHRWYPD